ncbi:response regulator transcription factor [Amycolatopsis sp. WQ 127309]|uniref:response regulator transcription factor n=1 Tax=Amycolatopsis sp. WQ 127309 TaxID=2932773 RepID=UPI001FF0E089|nr:response regulator transcription factor [Amycolatopsis sp. WQ 127309]UOZ03352.1 response regulator transcription factor [Amycolatopsis sp. WQ 127309]
MRVLVAECDEVERLVVAGALRRQGFEVETAGTVPAAVGAASGVDLVVLGLPAPGLAVCAAVRADSAVPIIGTAVPGSDIDLVTGLRSGLDAYLVRPVGIRELVARVDAILRRTLAGADDWAVVSCGPLRLNARTREVHRCGELVQVTLKEFDLLHLLTAEPDEVFTRREIMSRVWGDEWARSDRTIDTHVNSLRNKMGDPAVIRTIRGVGFRLGYRAMAGAGGRTVSTGS